MSLMQKQSNNTDSANSGSENTTFLTHDLNEDEYTFDEVKDVLDESFSGLTDDVLNAVVSELFTTQFETTNDVYKRAPKEHSEATISTISLTNALALVAASDGDYNTLSFDEVASTDSWRNLPSVFDTNKNEIIVDSERLDIAEADFNGFSNIEENGTVIEDSNYESAENVDITGYAKIDIGDGKFVRVPKDHQELVESLLEAESFKNSVLQSLASTDEDTLYILGSALPDNVWGRVASFGLYQDGFSAQAIMKINFDAINQYSSDNNLGDDEKNQLIARTIIHELGHIDGSLGSHENCDHGATFAGHGPEHSEYIAGIYNDWITSTGQKNNWDIEANDYSTDTYFDTHKQFSQKIPGSNLKLGVMYYDIQEALLTQDFDKVTELINLIPETMYLTRNITNAQTGAKSTITVSAREYIIGLLLYETIDVTGLGGSDTDSGFKKVLYASGKGHTNSDNYDDDTALEDAIKAYYSQSDGEMQKLFQDTAEGLALDDNLNTGILKSLFDNTLGNSLADVKSINAESYQV